MVHNVLKDRANIGEILHKGEWYPGKHEPLIDRATWDRVQVLLGGHIYQSHALTYAGDIIECGHCGHPITGEKDARKNRLTGRKSLQETPERPPYHSS